MRIEAAMAAPESNCSYCQGTDLLFKRNNVKIWVDGNLRLFDPKNKINTDIDINYCPMCGRKVDKCTSAE